MKYDHKHAILDVMFGKKRAPQGRIMLYSGFYSEQRRRIIYSGIIPGFEY